MLLSTAPAALAATPLQTSYGNPKQIAARATASGFVIYTVPAGKKFQGTVHSDVAAQTISFTPAGGSSVNFANIPTSFLTAPFLLTLVAGTIVTSASVNSTYLLGVETDA